MLNVAIRADLWDIEQEGCEDFLDHVRSELGFARLTVPVLHGPAHCVRAGRHASPRVFATGGGLAFQPDDEHFRATRLHPATADWLRTRNPMARLADAAKQAAFPLTAEIDVLGLAAATSKHDRGVRKNAFGDPMPGRVCAIDPDVRECVAGIAANAVAEFGADHVAIRGMDHTSETPPWRRNAPGPVAAWLLDQCFCESCRQQMSTAEIDADACARRASTLLETAFETGRAGYDRVADLLNDDEALRSMRRWSQSQAVTLLKHVRSHCETDVTVCCDCDAPATLINPAQQADLQVRWSHPCATKTIEETDSMIDALTSQVGMEALELRFSMLPDRTPDAQTLVRVMTHSAERGVTHLQIDDYGPVPTARHDWMRQAIRFASRAAG